MPKQVGRVIAFAHAQLKRQPGNNVTSEALYLAYVDWCGALGHMPFRDGTFRDQFAQLARYIQIISEVQDADRLYQDVGLRPANLRR